MAGDWIKIRTCLFTHPKVMRIAKHCGWTEEVVVGWLAKVWSWADSATESGHVDSVTHDDVSRVTGAPQKFLASMQSVGWLVQDSTGIVFPDYEEHMGKCAKSRVLAANRKKKQRDSLSRSQRDKSVTREEKNREEKSNKKSKPKEIRETRPASIDDVRAYCEERRKSGNNSVDPQTWWDYYESNGWRVGRNAMKDWRAAIRTWERNGVGKAGRSELGGRVDTSPAVLAERTRARRVAELVRGGTPRAEAIERVDNEESKNQS
jgi:hypothetical protein